MLNRFRALLISLPLLIAFVSAYAQQNAQVPTYRSKTEVVLVPVLVRSKTGTVEGLKAEQFSLTEDGKPQKIVSVELIKTGTDVIRRQTPGEFSNEFDATGPVRLTIVGIDMINTPFLDQDFARRQLTEYLSSSRITDEPTAIFGMYRDGSVRLLQDISTDSATLSKAVKASPGRLTLDFGAGDPDFGADKDNRMLPRSEAYRTGASGFVLRRNMEATLSSMRLISEAFWGAPGRKSFIWITGNFPFDISGSSEFVSPRSTSAGAPMDPARDLMGHRSALPPSPETTSLIGDDDLAPLRQQFRELLQQFASGNIVLYPLDARGLVTLNFEASESSYNPLRFQLEKEREQTTQSAMETMAKMTGGKACYNTNEIVSCIRDASQDSDEYYLVTYNRDKKNKKPGWRKLAVKVDQPDVEVRARSGYFFGQDSVDKNVRNREIRLAAQSKVPLSSVPFSARFKGITAAGNMKMVKYEIYIPPATVELADQGDNKFQLEVIAIVSTPKNPEVYQATEVLGTPLPPEAIAGIHEQGIAYESVLKVPSGEYTVRLMVRNAATNTIGSVIALLKVE